MNRKYSAAIIGCGRMGAFTSESVMSSAPNCCLPLSHADAIVSHPRLDLKALADKDVSALERASAKFGINRRYSDPIDLIRSESPELLGVATRTPGRAELICAAIESGTRAIHAEKPLCNSVQELRRLTNIFNRTEVSLTWGATRRFLSVYRQALDLAKSGRYGMLYEARINLGSAPLFWTHPHSIDLIFFAAEGRRLEGVQARLINVTGDLKKKHFDNDPIVEKASIFFESGFSGHITRSIGYDFILTCEYGEIVVQSDGARLELYAPRDSVYPVRTGLEIECTARPTGTLAPISHLVDCLSGDCAALEENYKIKKDIFSSQTAAFAMLQSHLEKSKIVKLSEIDPELLIYAKTGDKYA